MGRNEDHTTKSADSDSKIGFLVRIVIETFLAGHFVVGAYYWWLTPKGFPVTHCRFWLNTALPILVLSFLVLALAELLRQRPKVPCLCLLSCAAAWAAGTASGRLLFFESLNTLWLAGLFPILVAIGCFLLLAKSSRLKERSFLRFLSLLAGALLGFFVAWAQVPPTPATQPWSDLQVAEEYLETDSNQLPLQLGPIQVGDLGKCYPATGDFSLNYGDVKIQCSPLLQFDRISPDGFWSLLAPPPKAGAKFEGHAKLPNGQRLQYNDGSVIEIDEPTNSKQLKLTAFTTLSAETFSHLNSYCVLNIRGHRKLSVAFSPCKQTRIDVLPADYPTGRPARMAYLDANETFKVVQATSGEKGPFHQLTSGPLKRGEPLTLFFFNDDKPIGSIRLEDWTSQLSTTLSPTAGWQVPVNAIEFQRIDKRESEAPASQIWITLAATSVGRGWDCVGHRAGTYRNRMVFNAE